MRFTHCFTHFTNSFKSFTQCMHTCQNKLKLWLKASSFDIYLMINSCLWWKIEILPGGFTIVLVTLYNYRINFIINKLGQSDIWLNHSWPTDETRLDTWSLFGDSLHVFQAWAWLQTSQMAPTRKEKTAHNVWSYTFYKTEFL